MSRSATFSRRGFLQSAAVGSAAMFAAPALLRAKDANEKLNIAVIGCGGRGGHNLQQVAGENIVALCDVNEATLDKAGQQFPMAKKFTDFRMLYDKAAGSIDAVVVSTAEHTHAFATLPALQLGKHVYCEKPLTHGIWEARLIREAAEKAKVATQMGTQLHASENYHRVVELIQSGAIGPVTETHVWVSRAWGWQSEEAAKANKDIVFAPARPERADPVPSGLDWDLWLGPAPERPFSNVYLPGPKWYRWWDFGSGTMSDLGSHWIDLPFWALKLDAPKTIEAAGPPVQPELAPASMQVTYEYGQRGVLPPVKLSWYQGTNKPEIWTAGGIPQWPNGVLFIGEKGMLLADYGKHQLLPENEFKEFQAPEPFIPRSIGHHAEWIAAAKTGSPTGSPFSYAGPLTEANHLGNVAYRLGNKLEWDAANMKVTNDPNAEPLIKRAYRKGWSLG